MQWQDIIRRDAYLAGSIAARSWEWWKEEGGPEETAREAGLTPDEPAYKLFLRGWAEEIRENGIEELRREIKEQLELMKKAEQKGDPAEW